MVYRSVSSVQSLSRVRRCATLWTTAHQASLSIINSGSLLKLMSIVSVMPSNHLILCCPLLLLPSILPSIRVFSDESVLCIRWPKYWSFSFSISPSGEYSGLISSRMDKGLSRVFSNTTVKLSMVITQHNTLAYMRGKQIYIHAFVCAHVCGIYVHVRTFLSRQNCVYVVVFN